MRVNASLPITRTVCLLLISALLLWAEGYYRPLLAPLYTHVEHLLSPIQRLATLPKDAHHWSQSMSQSHESLRRDNAQLRAQLISTEAKLQQQNQILSDNIQLKALLGIQQPPTARLQIATVIGTNPNAQTPILLLDKGRSAHVRVGQSVIDASGLLGQIIHTTDTTSKLLLLTARDQAVAVHVARTGQRAIVTGTGMPDTLALSYMLKSADIRVGDTLISSGLGGRMAAGYRVGRVSHITRDASARFLQIEVTPAAAMDSGHYALIVQPLLAPTDTAPHTLAPTASRPHAPHS